VQLVNAPRRKETSRAGKTDKIDAFEAKMTRRATATAVVFVPPTEIRRLRELHRLLGRFHQNVPQVQSWRSLLGRTPGQAVTVAPNQGVSGRE